LDSDDDVPRTLTATTNQTELVELACRVRGKPAPAVTWSRGDDVIAAATSSDLYRVVDERQYRADLFTWTVTSRLLLQGTTLRDKIHQVDVDLLIICCNTKICNATFTSFGDVLTSNRTCSLGPTSGF